MGTRTTIDQAAAFAAWYVKLARESNPGFLPLFADEHRYLILKGGGGSGKSIFAGRKVIERCIAEPGHRFLVCRKVGRTIKQSCFQQLVGQVNDAYPDLKCKINRGDMSITFPNGSVILFSGLDDVEKLKSIYSITSIWVEEASELLEGDFNQLDIRLRGETKYYKQIIVSFNPISVTHWLKRRFFDTPDPRVRVHESTYLDNRFLDEEARRVLESFRETDEYYYMVYCLGQWGVTGSCVFDAKAIAERLKQTDDLTPVQVGFFEFDVTDDGMIANPHWVESSDGATQIYVFPQPGVPYVLGGDTAGAGSDCFVAQVLDNRTGEQVAMLRHTYDEDKFAKQVYCLGRWYNDALVGLETNYSTYPTMELERLKYPRQYVRETVDTFTHKLRKSFGFDTNRKTRPILVAALVQLVRENVELIHSRETLEEMLTFIRDENFRAAAEEGAHDDCVMSLGIAHQIRGQQRDTVVATRDPRTWTASMWEDYRNADPRERSMLIERWGPPKKE
jgi:phage terminase large subunit